MFREMAFQFTVMFPAYYSCRSILLSVSVCVYVVVVGGGGVGVGVGLPFYIHSTFSPTVPTRGELLPSAPTGLVTFETIGNQVLQIFFYLPHINISSFPFF